MWIKSFANGYQNYTVVHFPIQQIFPRNRIMQPISASISDRLHCGGGENAITAIFPAWRLAFMLRSTATIRLHFNRLSSPLNGGACIRPLSNWPTHFRHSRVLHPLHVKPTLTEIANEVCTPRPG